MMNTTEHCVQTYTRSPSAYRVASLVTTHCGEWSIVFIESDSTCVQFTHLRSLVPGEVQDGALTIRHSPYWCSIIGIDDSSTFVQTEHDRACVPTDVHVGFLTIAQSPKA